MATQSSMVDYALYDRLCELEGRDEETVPVRIREMLERSPEESLRLLREGLQCAQQEISALELGAMRQFREIEAAWLLADLRSASEEHGLLSLADPESTGMPCRHNDRPFLLTPEHLHVFFHAQIAPAVVRLWYQLGWWRNAVRCFWGAHFLGQVIAHVRTPKHLLPMGSVGIVSEESQWGSPVPLGAVLSFSGSSTDHLEKAFNLARSAQFGSAECETVAAQAFREWLRGRSFALLRESGIATAEEAHQFLLAASDRSPACKISFRWCGSSYTPVCNIENADACGYSDPSRSAIVPMPILMLFFEGAGELVKEALVRLLIRELWRQGTCLLFPKY